jgi:hypothetical protein
VRIAEKGMKEWSTFVKHKRRYHMPEVRLDIERRVPDKKRMEVPAVRRNQGIFMRENFEIVYIPLLLVYLLQVQEAMRRKIAHQHVEMQWHLTLIFNGGARILRAIASWIEFHLSPSYVLFNLKALSIVIARKVALGEKLLPVVGIGNCCGR